MTSTNVKRAIRVAIVVGSLLNLINSYDVFWYGHFTPRNVIRIILTYITPFCVSLYSSIKAAQTAQTVQPAKIVKISSDVELSEKPV